MNKPTVLNTQSVNISDIFILLFIMVYNIFLYQGSQKLVSVVSVILDTMMLVRQYILKTTGKLRHNWLDTVQLITFLLDTINSDSKGP